MFIDTHCHLNMIGKKNFDTLLIEQDYNAIQQALHEAYQANVQKVINVGTSLIESKNCVALAQRYEHCYAAIGIHPNDARADWKDDMRAMESLWFNALKDHKIVAIGEVGLDYHYPGYNKMRQHDVFCYSLELALRHKLPVIIHTRDAAEDTLRVLERYTNEPLRGIIHCFSEDYAFAKQVIQQGFVLGIGGTLTYPKNNHLREVCLKVDLEHIVLETDAPFLPPQALRGKTNYPKNIAVIAHYLAELLQCNIAILEATIQRTTEALFKF